MNQVPITIERSALAERSKGERRHNVGPLEEFWMIANLNED